MANAVDYAERELGVHTVYAEAQDLLERLDRWRSTFVREQGDVRMNRELLADAEAEFTSVAFDANSHLSQTAFEAHLRVAKRLDPGLKTARAAMTAAQSNLEAAESEVRRLERHLDVVTARLIELGGLCQLYAAARAAGK